jgi:hypothetical protein
MRAIRLVPVLFFFMLLGTQFPFLTEAYAACCGCGWCKTMMGCSCPGQNGCAWYPCRADDTTILQAKTLMGNEVLDIRGSHDPRPSPTLRSNSTDRIITPTSSGQCARNNFVQKFFQRAEDELKLEPDFLSYNVSQDTSIIAFQVPVHEEN